MARKIGLLAPDQPKTTPYAEARRYVTKVVAALLIRRAEVEIVADELLREKPKAALRPGTVMTSVDEIKRFEASLPHRVHAKNFSVVVRIPIPERAANESLDLCYPEPLRTTTNHPHAAMVEACRKALLRKQSGGQRKS